MRPALRCRPHGKSPAPPSTKSVELPRDHSSPKTESVFDYHEKNYESLSLRTNHRPSLATAVSTAPDIPTLEIDFPSPSHRTSQQQTIGLRAKKYLIPRLLSHRKFALAMLHPFSAAVMNDIHYLLKIRSGVNIIDHFTGKAERSTIGAAKGEQATSSLTMKRISNVWHLVGMTSLGFLNDISGSHNVAGVRKDGCYGIFRLAGVGDDVKQVDNIDCLTAFSTIKSQKPAEKSSTEWAHITPKAHFRKVDHIILRSLIKVGIVSEKLLDNRSAVLQMRRVERLSRNFGLIFFDLSSAAEEAAVLPSTSSPSRRLDVSVLLDTLKKLQEALNTLIEGQLSPNSINQMNSVFEELQDARLWQYIFDHSIASSDEWQLVRNLRNSFHKLIEAKLL
ncbi:hypothetical protein EGR_00834 [Echinococcus granulosus]|uniref:Uncharacterized protein n=1 Tax=Echinococcus granulosus TaxID=6210 RepID=W6URD0_ECHGR|nr:hypothetical protein EGR_00834 [Echinococcus granulosus]EUB64290.1 hypothetical protein EGR_00834 [Echinococcus granulosus]